MDTLLHNLPFYSHVRQTRPLESLKFGGKLDLIELINRFSPEFNDGALSLFHPLYFNGHLQTVCAAVKTFEDVDQVYYKRMVVNCSDGGEATADFRVSPWGSDLPEPDYVPPNQTKQLLPRYRYFSPDELKNLGAADSKPLLIVLHGLTGGSHEAYVRSLVNRITSEYEFEACVLNSRGCSQSSITTPQLYNGAWTDDTRDFVKKLRELFPHRKFYLVGFSLGASIAANYLGQEGEDSQIECAAILGNPWDLCNASYYMNRTLLGRQLYGTHFSQSLVKMVKDNLDVLKRDPYMAKLYAEKLETVKTVEEFDNWFTSRMFGFNSSYEYYRYGTSSNRVPQIRTPMLVISATDDPIVGQESLPKREIEGNPFTLLIETSKGGHIAWFDSKGERWHQDPLCRFFNAFHNEICAKGLKADTHSVTLPHRNKFVGDRLVNATVRDY
ncbi:LANO_0H15918g1_1 [Lachancea nothofagi CBS 11611]|uniref:LANO_0H15918g1_1 n=1 Tax=Lachancea nothofagi CBS 11611 TaxID=1266666 RepID=A0A1G4KMP9_9SACH|nr:LANO_0H15918g1_1 [Lachancea nothofagi CBS 11611]